MSRRVKTTWGLFLVFLVSGFLLATQARVQKTAEGDLALKTTDELTTLIGTLTQENDRLQAEVTDLRLMLMRSRYAKEEGSVEIAQQQQTLGDLQRVTGMVSGYGPGVTLEVEDSLGELNAYELEMLVNELKSAGAEAILINNERLDFTSYFGNAQADVVLDGRRLEEPYSIRAVGDPESLFSSLVMAGGVIPSLETRPGVSVVLEKQARIEVPADGDPPTFLVTAATE